MILQCQWAAAGTGRPAAGGRGTSALCKKNCTGGPVQGLYKNVDLVGTSTLYYTCVCVC
eukprot:SAG11_NODE_27814_length_328_cov_1.917031_1_plen_58_part_10